LWLVEGYDLITTMFDLALLLLRSAKGATTGVGLVANGMRHHCCGLEGECESLFLGCCRCRFASAWLRPRLDVAHARSTGIASCLENGPAVYVSLIMSAGV
jgi:hypothetical protein